MKQRYQDKILQKKKKKFLHLCKEKKTATKTQESGKIRKIHRMINVHITFYTPRMACHLHTIRPQAPASHTCTHTPYQTANQTPCATHFPSIRSRRRSSPLPQPAQAHMLSGSSPYTRRPY